MSIMFLQSSPPLCPTSSLSCLTQFPSFSPLHLSLSVSVFFSLLPLSSLFSIQFTKIHRPKQHNLSLFFFFYSVCSSVCMKFVFCSNPGGPATTTPTLSVCAALDTRLSVYASEEDVATLIMIYLVTPAVEK